LIRYTNQRNLMKTKLLTTDEVAKILRVCNQTIYRYVNQGKLTPVSNTTGMHLFRESDLAHIVQEPEETNPSNISTRRSLSGIFNSDAFRLHSLLQLLESVHPSRRNSFQNGNMDEALRGYLLTPSSIRMLIDALIGFDFNSFILSDFDIVKDDLFKIIQNIEESTGNNLIIIISQSARVGVIEKEGTTVMQAHDLEGIYKLIEGYVNSNYQVIEAAAEPIVFDGGDTKKTFKKAEDGQFKKMNRKELEKHRETITSNALVGNSKYRK